MKKIDLGTINSGAVQGGPPAKLIPIIPPSKGHGFDLYKELGADRVLVYARFDDSTKDFPIDSQFAQVSLVKNPTSFGTTSVYTGSTFSALKSICSEKLFEEFIIFSPLSELPTDPFVNSILPVNL